MAAYFSRTGGGVFANPPTTISSDLIPAIDNTYILGNATNRWKSISIGPGTLYLQDTVTGLNAAITVTNGQLLTNNVGALVTGNVVLLDAITGYAATMNVQNKVLTFSNVSSVKANAVVYSDGLTQSNAYIKPTAKVYPTSPTISSLDIDMSTSNAYIHCHCNGQLNITVSNATPAKTVQVFAYWGGGGSNYITSSGPQILAANGTNPYFVTKQWCAVTVSSVDTTLANTFMVIQNF